MSGFLKKHKVLQNALMVISGPLAYGAIVICIFAAFGKEAAELFTGSTSFSIGGSVIAGQNLPAIPPTNIGMLLTLAALGKIFWPYIQKWRANKTGL